ncbi:MAG TPA: YggS family pyridoxal phosphate-dependent enzyme [Gemmatimonadaceae bacterium]|nr:YggS family pyridoxal phosphate-dependent enzyme [Gemmatimonadaceae bacterium]
MLFQDLGARLAEVGDRVAAAVARGGHGQRVTVIAVTKTHGPEAVRAAWQSGVLDVGENKVQEALGKMAAVDVPVRWHLIGHLQRNKVRDLDHFALVHSIDRASLADAVSAFGIARRRSVDALVQVNVAGEETKGGFAPADMPAEAERFVTRAGLRITGVMTMAPLNATERETRRVFEGARTARELLVSAGHPAFELSMGMSNDYELAVEEGARMIRLGTVLFGERGS